MSWHSGPGHGGLDSITPFRPGHSGLVPYNTIQAEA